MKYRSTIRFVLEGMEGVLVLATVLGTWPVSKRWLDNLGSNRQERNRRWPGDHYVSANHMTHTRALRVGASAETVWRWVVQFGLGRGGFYSYELLERLAGIPVTNLESVEPAFQSLEVGDEIRLHPRAPGIPIAEIERGRRICFGTTEDADSTGTRGEPARSWSIYIEPMGGDACRLLLRSCIEPRRNPSWVKRVGAAIEEPIDFVMEQRMLRTIRRLAESSPG